MEVLQEALNEDQIAYVLSQICEGLAYLHAAKKIHRDLKCGNILVNQAGLVKIGRASLKPSRMLLSFSQLLARPPACFLSRGREVARRAEDSFPFAARSSARCTHQRTSAYRRPCSAPSISDGRRSARRTGWRPRSSTSRNTTGRCALALSTQHARCDGVGSGVGRRWADRCGHLPTLHLPLRSSPRLLRLCCLRSAR